MSTEAARSNHRPNSVTFAQAAELCRGLERVLIVSHYNPDADAYGSQCGMALGLRAIGVDTLCLNQDGRVERYGYIPGLSEVRSELPAGCASFDTVIVCDCGDANRIGERLLPIVRSAKRVLNLDHHISNDGFGTHNLVLDNASSTAEIVFEILALIPGALTVEAASCLYVGIAGDTGSFRYSSTSARTFQIAARLLEIGVKADKISHAMFSSTPLVSVRLQSEAMNKLEMLFGGLVAQVVVTNDMYERHKATREDADNLVERARDIEGVCLSILIKQDGPIWRVSLRSSDVRYNVSEVAASMGGGGHKMAAAFRWSGALEELRRVLHGKIEAILRR